MHAPLTGLYAACLAIVIIALALRVVKLRRRHGVGLGVGQVRELERAVRVHANAIEYVPIALVMMAIYEIDGGSAWAIHAAGGALIAGRLLHAWGLSRKSGTSFGRFWGVGLTIAVWVGLAAGNVWLYLSTR